MVWREPDPIVINEDSRPLLPSVRKNRVDAVAHRGAVVGEVRVEPLAGADQPDAGVPGEAALRVQLGVADEHVAI